MEQSISSSRGVSIPKPERICFVGYSLASVALVRALTRDEYARLLAELPEHLRDMAQFSVATGLRQANVTWLHWNQISLERRHLWMAADQHKNGGRTRYR